MTDLPVNLQIYIRLITKKPLAKNEAKEWYYIVKKYGPNGIIDSIPMVRPKKEPGKVKLFHKTTDKKHMYEIPLKRSLNPKEVEEIKKAWDAFSPENHDEIEYSDIEKYSSGTDLLPVEPNWFDAFCEKLAKHKHQMWVKDMADSHWNYGLTFNKTKKTHPMLLPWEQLPEKYKEIDKEFPKMFLELLKNEGYRLVKK